MGFSRGLLFEMDFLSGILDWSMGFGRLSHGFVGLHNSTGLRRDDIACGLEHALYVTCTVCNMKHMTFDTSGICFYSHDGYTQHVLREGMFHSVSP